MKGIESRTKAASALSAPRLVAMLLALAVAAAMTFAMVSPAKSQNLTTFTVDRGDDRAPQPSSCTDAPNPDCTLREAIVAANAVEGGEVVIDFAVDEVTLSVPGPDENGAETGDLDITRSMAIDGSPPDGEGDGVIIGSTSGDETDPFDDRIFEIVSFADVSERPDVTIESVTVQEGDATSGKFIRDEDSGDVTFEGTINGGGIAVNPGASLTLLDSVVQNNTALGVGGGVNVENQIPAQDGDPAIPGGAATIRDSLITQNTTGVRNNEVNNQPNGAGGGVSAQDGATLDLLDSVVSDNVSENFSGGVASAGPTTIERSTISGNTAVSFTGGVGIGTLVGGSNENAGLLMLDTTINNNTASAGGGLAITEVEATVANTTISGNFANGVPGPGNPLGGVGGGVGVVGAEAEVFLESVTVANNRANAAGGGLATNNAAFPNQTGDNTDAINAVNTIVADNAAPTQCFGVINSLGFNLEFPALPAPSDCGFEITEDPLLEDLAVNEPGTTATHAIPKESPAVDQGNTELATDQRGVERPSDFLDVPNATDGADIGAFELQAPAPPTCAGQPATIVAQPGDERVIGTAGDDVIVGTDGDDDIFAGAGNDIVCGLGGNDTIRGGDGGDRLFGGAGDDVILGLAGNDQLYGQDGNDQLFGGIGNDFIVGQRGNDTLYGQQGNDYLNGGLGNDVLFGQAGRDGLVTRDGVRGNDTARGGTGIDFCNTDLRDRRISCERP